MMIRGDFGQKPIMARGRDVLSAWETAQKLGGDKNVRMATMTDVVCGRLSSGPGQAIWDNHFTTLTSEYLGFDRENNPKLVIVQKAGPLGRIINDYRPTGLHGFSSEGAYGLLRGARILRTWLCDLLDAEARGDNDTEISVIEMCEYRILLENPFNRVLRASEALADPLVQARLGKLWVEAYVKRHAEHARLWHAEQAAMPRCPATTRDIHRKEAATNSDPYIINLGDEESHPYLAKDGPFREISEESGYALAHLIWIGGAQPFLYDGCLRLVSKLGCYGWDNTANVIGIQEGGDISLGLRNGADPSSDRRV